MTAHSTVADHMTPDPVTVQATLPMADAVALLISRNISGVPVVDAGHALIGILTAKDCFKAALHASYYQEWGGVVADFMSHDVQTLDAQTDIISAAQKFQTSSYRRYPVTRAGRLVGILTRLDVLRALSRQI